MTKIILIYANCVNYEANGDFSLAGSLAKDLAEELEKQRSDTRVMLTSTMSGLGAYERLYGKAEQGKVFMNGRPLALIALEQIDVVNHQVIAFIEANRCQYAPSELVKRVLSPESMLIFVAAGNKPVPYSPEIYVALISERQPNLYPYFDMRGIHVLNSGLGVRRIGLPTIKGARELPEISVAEKDKFPKQPYGFMYFTDTDNQVLITIIQYIMLTKGSQYVLVGNFEPYQNSLNDALATLKIAPSIMYYKSLPNQTMRQVAANSNLMVGTTGVMSTLESMHDGKLTFYQTLYGNQNFVASYLLAVRSICQNDKTLVGAMPNLIIRMSELLFADKPLSREEFKKLNDLSASSEVTDHMVDVNHQIVNQANGKIAGHLLGFIGRNSQHSVHTQRLLACKELKKPSEANNPTFEQALRRAASAGNVFLLKILMQTMSVKEISNQDIKMRRNALHWAVMKGHLDCATLLIKKGIKLDCTDKDDKTPLQYARLGCNQQMITLLTTATAAEEAQHHENWSPSCIIL